MKASVLGSMPPLKQKGGAYFHSATKARSSCRLLCMLHALVKAFPLSFVRSYPHLKPVQRGVLVMLSVSSASQPIRAKNLFNLLAYEIPTHRPLFCALVQL